ncbi:proline iminopeptidase-family hydrolase [Ornithinibacillus bavariensis]|uniref:Proline iminopeptidase n=1 Tax=Ornithinibacillus bavariensis TaxID=545502 RepID=A0A919X6Q4_9BACI|nr:proline iminopeptidase-family hydrolase [Ornithinibacillus bavariensis]GIO25883.1 proline iminopeptidase [Ornithinibacillus bavariensis]
MPITEGFIEVTGGKVWYQKHDNSTNNAPVLILHGGPGSSHWSLQGLKELADVRPVILYDQLGCGKSDRPEDTSLWNIDRFVEEVKQLKDGLGLEEFHILGHSWGTTLAAAYYLKNPEGVQSIVFSSPCLSAPLWAKDQAENIEKLPHQVQSIIKECELNGETESDEYKEAIKVFNNHFVCRLPESERPAFLKEGVNYKNPEIYNIMWGSSEFHVAGNLKSFDCTPDLHKIQVPTLYTCGRFDEATPESTVYFSQLTPNSKYHIFEKSAHMPYIEEPAEYLKIMRSFLSQEQVTITGD